MAANCETFKQGDALRDDGKGKVLLCYSGGSSLMQEVD
jgi:hypothetical protein